LESQSLTDNWKAGVFFNPEKAKYQKYLIARKSGNADNGVTVSVREEVVQKELQATGWFVLISNHVENEQRAYDLYLCQISIH